MRVGNVFNGRPPYYDRTPATRVNQDAQIASAPVGLTQRWTYTVPTGKKFAIGMLALLAERVTAGAPGVRIEATISIAPLGAGPVVAARALLNTNGVGDRVTIAPASGLVLVATDIISGNSMDTSTGGTYSAFTSASGTEFDA